MPSEQDSVSRKLKPSNMRSGVASSAGAGILTILSGIALVPLIVVTVGASEYGVWIVMSTLAVFFYNSDLGIGSAIVHFSAQTRGGRAALSGVQICTSGIVWMAAVSVVALPVYAGVIYTFLQATDPPVGSDVAYQLALLGLVACGGLFLRAYSSILIGLGFLSYERRNQSVGVVVRVVGTLVACLWFDSILAVAAAEVAALVTPPLLSLITVWRGRLTRFAPSELSLGVLGLMLNYSIRVFGVNALGAAIMQWGSVVVGFTMPAEAVTYFNFSFRIYAGLRQIVSWITEPLRPALSRLFTSDRKGAVSLVAASLTSVPLICFASGVLVASSMPGLMAIGFKDGSYASAVPACVLIMLAGLFVNSFHLAFIPACDAIGRPGIFFRLQLCWFVLYVVGSIPLTAMFGIVGTGMALSVSLLILEPLYILAALRALDLTGGMWFESAVKPVLSVFVGTCVGAGLFFLADVWLSDLFFLYVLPFYSLLLLSVAVYLSRARIDLAGLKSSMSAGL